MIISHSLFYHFNHFLFTRTLAGNFVVRPQRKTQNVVFVSVQIQRKTHFRKKKRESASVWEGETARELFYWSTLWDVVAGKRFPSHLFVKPCQDTRTRRFPFNFAQLKTFVTFEYGSRPRAVFRWSTLSTRDGIPYLETHLNTIWKISHLDQVT